MSVRSGPHAGRWPSAKRRYEAWESFVHLRLRAGADTTVPHCDSRVLHRPEDCAYCDRPAWQAQRQALRIAHTGASEIPPGFVRCPADVARAPGSMSDHRRWGGNLATSQMGDPSMPVPTLASAVLYGDTGGRERRPLRELVERRARRALDRLRGRRR